MTPHLCPVCLGTGNVPGGFYNCCPGGTPISNGSMDKCKACVNGVIYDTPPYTITTTSGGGQNATFEAYHCIAPDPNLEKILKIVKAINTRLIKFIQGQSKNV